MNTVPTSKLRDTYVDDDNKESEEKYSISLSTLGVRVAARAYATSVSFSLENISDLTRQEREQIEAEVNREGRRILAPNPLPPQETGRQKIPHLLFRLLNFFCTTFMHYMPYRVGKFLSGSR